jgi:hypothetical protein
MNIRTRNEEEEKNYDEKEKKGREEGLEKEGIKI